MAYEATQSIDTKPGWTTQSAGTVDDGGVRVSFPLDSDIGGSTLNINASNHVIWMQIAEVSGPAGYKHQLNLNLRADAGTATSNYAEVGVIHAGVTQIDDPNDANGAFVRVSGSVLATANGAEANAWVGDLSVTGSAPSGGNDGSWVSASIRAESTGEMGRARTHLTGDVSVIGVSGRSIDVTANVSAVGNGPGAGAFTTIDGTFHESATSDWANAVFSGTSAASATQGMAIVEIGNAVIESHGGQHASTTIMLSGPDYIIHHLSASATATGQAANDVTLTAGSVSGAMVIGDFDYRLDGASGSHGTIQLNDNGTDFGLGAIHVGEVNVFASSGSAVQVNMFDTLRHPTTIGALHLSGGGSVTLSAITMSEHDIDRGSDISQLQLHYGDASRHFIDGSASLADAPMVTVRGFAPSHDSIDFDGITADGSNFSNVGSFSNMSDLNVALNAALDGTHKYVFAVYTGNEDINHNGVAGPSDAGVLAFDEDGNGMTAVVILQGVKTLTPADLA